MTARIDANRLAPEGRQAMAALQAYVNRSGLESALLELVKIRASQINGWNRSPSPSANRPRSRMPRRSLVAAAIACPKQPRPGSERKARVL